MSYHDRCRFPWIRHCYRNNSKIYKGKQGKYNPCYNLLEKRFIQWSDTTIWHHLLSIDARILCNNAAVHKVWHSQRPTIIDTHFLLSKHIVLEYFFLDEANWEYTYEAFACVYQCYSRRCSYHRNGALQSAAIRDLINTALRLMLMCLVSKWQQPDKRPAGWSRIAYYYFCS